MTYGSRVEIKNKFTDKLNIVKMKNLTFTILLSTDPKKKLIMKNEG